MASQQFFEALQSGNVTKAKKIIRKLDPNASMLPARHEIGHYPPLCAVAETGIVEIMRALIDKGANVNGEIGMNGMTALYIACQEGFHEMVSLLIANGAKINYFTRDTEPGSPLHISCQFGHLKVVKLLVNSGADVNAIKPDDGNTALLVAVRTLHIDIANFLISHGANVSIPNKCGITALMIAANRGMEGIVQALLEAGEDPNQEDWTFGCSAIDFAFTAGQTEIAEMLKAFIAERRATSSTCQDEANNEKTGGAGIDSDLKQMASMKVNIYTSPLQNTEIAGGEFFQREQKFKFCANASCGISEDKACKKLKKCDRCRCVRYCGRECQVSHWPTHKQVCKTLKPLC